MSAYPPKADMRRGRDVACASLLDPCGPRGRPSDRGVLRAGDWPWPEAAHLRSRVISTWSSAGWLWPATMNLQKGCRRNGGAKRGRKCSGGFNFEHLWMMGSDCGPSHHRNGRAVPERGSSICSSCCQLMVGIPGAVHERDLSIK